MKINIEDAKYLKFEDLKHKDVVTVANEGVWQDSNFKDENGELQSEFRISFKLANGEVKSTTLRSSNVKQIGRTFGVETKTWIGKELRAWKTKSEKAKAGYVFLFVPTDWERDDTGEWVIPENQDGYPTAESEGINHEDSPF